MLYNDYNNIDEYDNDMDIDENAKVKTEGGAETACCPPQPPCMCTVMGVKIMKSAVHFENSLADYLRCQCRIIRRLIRDGQYEVIDDILKQMGDNLHEIYNIESQIINKIEKGAYLSNCLEPEG